MNPLILALAACIGQGMCGTLITIYMSEISAHKVKPFPFYAMANLLGGVLAWCLVPFSHPEIPERLPLLTCILGTCGFLYVIALFVQVQCFSLGHKGLTSACHTSSIVIPFLFGILAMGEHPGVWKYVGEVMLLVGMILCALNQKQEKKAEESSGNASGKQNGGNCSNYGKWLLCLLLCIALSGVAEIFRALTSWWGFDNVSGMFRAAILMTLSGIGNVIACICTRTSVLAEARATFKWACAWAVIGTLTNLMSFVALDAMTKVGIGGLTVTISSSASLLFFMFYTALRFREKYRLATIVGILVCLGGIVFIGLGK